MDGSQKAAGKQQRLAAVPMLILVEWKPLGCSSTTQLN